MRQAIDSQTGRTSRGPCSDAVVTLLAAAGLRAEQVERCPDPTCPLCAGSRRAA